MKTMSRPSENESYVTSQTTPSFLSHRGVFEAASRISKLHAEGEDAESVGRWRRVVLRLADTMDASATSHPHLAPMLMEAMDNAIEQLLLFGREGDLLALDDWLSMESN